jgi:hypothetical protein
MDNGVATQVETHFHREEWTKARSLISKALRTNKVDHWLITRLATAYYEQHKYKRALELDRRALRLAPRCPLALWD